MEGLTAVHQFIHYLNGSNAGKGTTGDTLLELLKIRDGEGRTAMDVAEMLGHQEMLAVLSQFSSSPLHHGKEQEEEDEDYIYDLYCVEDDRPRDVSSVKNDPNSGLDQTSALNGDTNVISDQTGDANDHGLEKTADQAVVVNMRGGVGYWNEDGELVIDVFSNENDMTGDSDLDEEEYDSNREDCDANEYPDDDDLGSYEDTGVIDANGYGVEGGYRGNEMRFGNSTSDSDADDSYDDEIDFRHRAIDQNCFASSWKNSNNIQYSDDDGDYRGFMFSDSASLGKYDMHGESFMNEAYDSGLDEDD